MYKAASFHNQGRRSTTREASQERDLAAGLLSLFPTLILGEHHGTNGNQSIDKEPIDSVTKKDVSIASHLSHGGF